MDGTRWLWWRLDEVARRLTMETCELGRNLVSVVLARLASRELDSSSWCRRQIFFGHLIFKKHMFLLLSTSSERKKRFFCTLVSDCCRRSRRQSFSRLWPTFFATSDMSEPFDTTYTPIPRHDVKFVDPNLEGLPFTRIVTERRQQPGRWFVTIQPWVAFNF